MVSKINKLISTIGFIFSLALLPVISYAQTAAILPNARTQFIDANGQPLVGGTVGFYIPETTTPKGTWQDPAETIPNTNPIVLDSLGSALIWGRGNYREILKDSNGSVVWDSVTAGALATTGGTVTSITAGPNLTGGTITGAGTIGLSSNVPLLNADNLFTNRIRITAGASTGTNQFLDLLPSDYSPTHPGLVFYPAGDGASWIFGSFGSGGGTFGNIDIQSTFLTFNGSSLLTTATGAQLAAPNTFTAYNQITAGNSTANSVWLSFRPSDYGVGKPALSFQKDATANSWTLGCFDTATDNCVLRLSASSVVIPGALTVSGGSTVNGSAICTMATGCTGGGGGGGYATVYDVAATYGGDPTGGSDNVTPFNNALAACAGTNGGIIWFQAGNWRFNSAINDNVQGCSIQGAGAQATNFVFYGATGNFISVNAYNSGVSNLGILNGGVWTSGFGLAVGVSAGASLATYNNLYFDAIPGFIYVTGSSETKFTNIYGVDPLGAAAYQCDGAGATQVFGTRWNNVALGYGSTNTSTNGFHMGSGCNTWTMSQISSSGAAGGSGNDCLVMDSGASFLVLDDFECDHSVNGANINGGTGIQIVNSWFGSTLTGNGLTFGSGFSGFASISNSHIRDNAAIGVLINGSGGVQVVGNVISGNATADVAVGANISNFQINSNQLSVPGDPTATYGALVNSGTSNYYVIANNLCASTATNCVVDGGSGSKKSVTGNVGP